MSTNWWGDKPKPSLWVRLLLFVNPDWRPRNLFVAPEISAPSTRGLSEVIEVEQGKLASEIHLVRTSENLSNWADSGEFPRRDTIWVFKDSVVLQVLGHFGSNSGNRYKARSSAERKKLKPFLYPNQGKAYDRTHLIPIGYHGSESDQWLLVGWDSDQNRNDLKEFEKAVKKLDFPIFWYTEVRKESYGASWHYRIYNANNISETSVPIKTLDLELRCDFIWTL